MCRLLVGHTHFDVDQRHSVLSRKILGRRGRGDRGRRELHSFSAFEQVVREAHKDLNFFHECTANYNFDEWLASMESRHEPGLSKHMQYQLRCDNGVVLCRSKPRMSQHVPYNSWSQIWPVDEAYWTADDVQPVAPAYDSCPPACPPQKWKNFAEVKKSLTSFYDDSWWGISAADKQEMKTLLQKWGNKPERECPLPPEWPNFEEVMPRVTSQPITIDAPRRAPPLIAAPYVPLGMGRKRRRRNGRGHGRGRGRGRAANGRGRVANRRGRVANGRGRVTNIRGRGGTCRRLVRARNGLRRIIMTDSSSDTSSTDSSDDEILSVVRDRVRKYSVGTLVRKTFSGGWFNGKVIRVDYQHKLWSILYEDGDCEDMDFQDMITHTTLYNEYKSKQ